MSCNSNSRKTWLQLVTNALQLPPHSGQGGWVPRNPQESMGQKELVSLRRQTHRTTQTHSCRLESDGLKTRKTHVKALITLH